MKKGIISFVVDTIEEENSFFFFEDRDKNP
jgi:hypothetical protein